MRVAALLLLCEGAERVLLMRSSRGEQEGQGEMRQLYPRSAKETLEVGYAVCISIAPGSDPNCYKTRRSKATPGTAARLERRSAETRT